MASRTLKYFMTAEAALKKIKIQKLRKEDRKDFSDFLKVFQTIFKTVVADESEKETEEYKRRYMREYMREYNRRKKEAFQQKEEQARTYRQSYYAKNKERLRKERIRKRQEQQERLRNYAKVDFDTMFRSCQNHQELRKLWHKLQKEHHPDLGGNNNISRDINIAYDKAKERLHT